MRHGPELYSWFRDNRVPSQILAGSSWIFRYIFSNIVYWNTYFKKDNLIDLNKCSLWRSSAWVRDLLEKYSQRTVGKWESNNRDKELYRLYCGNWKARIYEVTEECEHKSNWRRCSEHFVRETYRKHLRPCTAFFLRRVWRNRWRRACFAGGKLRSCS